ncbi:MAG TPA: hypothetical protein VK841_19525 [Polyangiaceae bacterium]|jgi:hypothetical protein|nr:hypothetical protein [Polyangiaceae bacterium]
MSRCDHPISECTCTESEIDVLYISPERFRASPQVGVPCRMPWGSLGAYLSRPSIGDSKDEAGAWSPALYRDNIRRKANLLSIGALVLDFDENGDVDLVADALSLHEAIIHETFSSTNDAPRCRGVLLLAESIDAATYETAHAIVRMRLAQVRIVADDGAKDASRVSYSPVRRAGAGYRVRVTHGEPFDAYKVIETNRPKAVAGNIQERLPVTPTGDRYIDAAISGECDTVASAPEGSRNDTLNKAAYSLARLHISDGRIFDALSDAAKRAGLSQHEAEKTISSALRARRRAS